MFIIGIDCATDEKRTGLAFGFAGHGKPSIHTVALGSKNRKAVDLVEEHLPKDQPALLALDAPLGWPAALGSELSAHFAGMPLSADPDDLFSRQTDRIIKEKLKKRPLEVGANLIARTAHAALCLLQCLRTKTGLTLPLAWEPGEIRGAGVIEVYPAATLIAHGLDSRGYKKPGAHSARRRLLELLRDHVEIVQDRELLESNADALDAAICVLAASDFLQGKCIQSPNLELARREGWIWVRHPEE